MVPLLLNHETKSTLTAMIEMKGTIPFLFKVKNKQINLNADCFLRVYLWLVEKSFQLAWLKVTQPYVAWPGSGLPQYSLQYVLHIIVVNQTQLSAPVMFVSVRVSIDTSSLPLAALHVS